MVEITATGRGLRATYAYILRDLGQRTEVAVDATVVGMPAPVAWLTSAIGRLYPNRDRSEPWSLKSRLGESFRPRPFVNQV